MDSDIKHQETHSNNHVCGFCLQLALLWAATSDAMFILPLVFNM
jgi:hypothetical protein